MHTLKLIWLRKNWSKDLPKPLALRIVAGRLEIVNHVTVKNMLEGIPTRHPFEHLMTIDHHIELLRAQPEVWDASFLLPSQVSLKYRYATESKNQKGYQLWDCRMPPIYKLNAWYSQIHGAGTLQVSDHFLHVPPTMAASEGKELYIRDLVTRAWFKSSLHNSFTIEDAAYLKEEANPTKLTQSHIVKRLSLYEGYYE